MRLLRSLLALLLCAPASLAAQTALPTGSTTVIVVRHAEKAAEPAADPPLTAAGAARAEALVSVLKDAGVQAIVSTHFARTRNTVAPLAASLGITPEFVDPRAPKHAQLVADSLLARHRGHTVVVVGHSNTVPDIVAALGARKPADICDDEYDNLYLVVVPPSGKATVTKAKYGTATVGDGKCREMSRE